jgi:serine/threonine protein kinase
MRAGLVKRAEDWRWSSLALAHAASQGILHRDIKPSNLLLDETGNVWVTDFGLAKATSDGDNLTHTGDIIGTMRYMAPERFNGQGDLRSDVYSLGLTLYELLTLRPAFGESDRNKLIKQVMHDEPIRPRRLNRSVPRDLETVVLKAIARDPAQSGDYRHGGGGGGGPGRRHDGELPEIS